MSGNIIEHPMSYAVRGRYEEWNSPPKYEIVNGFVEKNRGNTLVFVASLSNSPEQVRVFEEGFKDNIVFKSKKSVNGSTNHGTLPRNTLYIVDIPK